MSISHKIDNIHLKVRQNKWLWFFAIFNRVMLALGFLPSGFVKVNGERFTALETTHPMGNFLEAFYHTGFYYPFVGVMQITAGILLLIPRTATIGALIYFPIILNIFLLSVAVPFEGSLFTSPLMLMANVYLLCWDWHKLKFIFFPNSPKFNLPGRKGLSNKFPIKFFAGSAASVLTVVAILIYMNLFTFIPRNQVADCKEYCKDLENPQACLELCDCVHTTRVFNFCIRDYKNRQEPI